MPPTSADHAAKGSADLDVGLVTVVVVVVVPMWGSILFMYLFFYNFLFHSAHGGSCLALLGVYMWVLSFVPAVHGRLTFFSFLLITRLKKAHQWRVDPSTHRPKANEKNATALKPRGSLACLPVPQCVGRLPLGSLVGRPFFCLLRPTCGIGRQNIKTPKKHQQANMGVGSGLGFAIARFFSFFVMYFFYCLLVHKMTATPP